MKRFLCAGEGYGFFSKISTNLIIPLNFGCVLIVCLVSTLFLAHPSSAQQMQTEISRVTAGQKVPEAFWTTEFQFYDHQNFYIKNLEESRGKAIILAFWSVSCGSCIHSFPLLKNAVDDHSENLTVIPVNSYDKESRIPVIDKVISKYGENYRIPSIMYDDYLKKVFSHVSIPHYVWISSRGVVIGITTKHFLTSDNISQFVDRYGKE